jgi:hypothetical protein
MTSQRTLWVFYLIVWEQVTRVREEVAEMTSGKVASAICSRHGGGGRDAVSDKSRDGSHQITGGERGNEFTGQETFF